MHDLLGHVVLTPGDVDLLAGDRVGAIVVGHGLRRERTDVGAGLRFGEVHGAGPFAGDHLGQVGILLLVAAVVQEGIDRTLGQQRAQRESHVG